MNTCELPKEPVGFSNYRKPTANSSQYKFPVYVSTTYSPPRVPKRSRKSKPSPSKVVMECKSFYLREIDDSVEVCDKSLLENSEQKQIQVKIDTFIQEKRAKLTASN